MKMINDTQNKKNIDNKMKEYAECEKERKEKIEAANLEDPLQTGIKAIKSFVGLEAADQSREGKVQKDVQVRRGGKTFTQKRWVKAGEDAKAAFKPVGRSLEPKTPAGRGKVGQVFKHTAPPSAAKKEHQRIEAKREQDAKVSKEQGVPAGSTAHSVAARKERATSSATTETKSDFNTFTERQLDEIINNDVHVKNIVDFLVKTKFAAPGEITNEMLNDGDVILEFLEEAMKRGFTINVQKDETLQKMKAHEANLVKQYKIAEKAGAGNFGLSQLDEAIQSARKDIKKHEQGDTNTPLARHM